MVKIEEIAISEFNALLKQEKINEAIDWLKQGVICLDSNITFFMRRNSEVSDADKDELVDLVRNTLFKFDSTPNNKIFPFLKKKHFNPEYIINFIVKYKGRIPAVSQIYSLNGEAILLFLTVVRENNQGYDTGMAGRGLYGLFMAFKYLYAVTTNHKFVIGRTQNPLALEQYDKHGLFYNPSLYYKVHKSDPLAVPREKAEFLVNQAKRIYESCTGIAVTDELMISSEQVDSARYKVTKQPARSAIMNEFIEKNILGAERFLAIKQIDNSSIMLEITDNIEKFIKKQELKT